MRVYTRFNPPDYEGVSNNGQSLVERTGYIPVKDQVEMFQRAGVAFENWRHDKYDYDIKPEEDPKDPFEYEDPTRRPGFDVVDAQRLGETITDNLSEVSNESSNVSDGSPAPDSGELGRTPAGAETVEDAPVGQAVQP